jgi:hypothetical protein
VFLSHSQRPLRPDFGGWPSAALLSARHSLIAKVAVDASSHSCCTQRTSQKGGKRAFRIAPCDMGKRRPGERRSTKSKRNEGLRCDQRGLARSPIAREA